MNDPFDSDNQSDQNEDAGDNEALIDRLQRGAFNYFVRYGRSDNGLVADSSRDDSPCSVAVVGFALSSYPVGVERGWMTRNEALSASLAALRFFQESDQSGSPEATGYRGFYYHFLDQESGKRAWKSELSMIDTAMLISGALVAAEFFDAKTAEEHELRALVRSLYDRIDWCWAQNGGTTITLGWKPESGFLNYGWEGYSEALLLYALALGSSTTPIGSDGYKGWTETYQWENLYGGMFLYAGPLFIHQFSHAWVDLRGIRDAFMREKGCDYFENSRRAVRIQQEYTRINPLDHAGLSKDLWGLSAGDGPTDEDVDAKGEPRKLFGYSARGVPYGPDDGTLSPPAVLACLPFEPKASIRCLRALLRTYPSILTEDRLSSGLNAGVRPDGDSPWISPGWYGLDQGIVVLMVENHRTGLIWQLMRQCTVLRTGLLKAGFKGGWMSKVRSEDADE